MRGRLRVGMLTTSFPRFPGDIAGNFVLELANALAAKGHAIEVLAPEPASHARATAFPGIDVHHVPYLRPRGLQRTFYGAGVPDNLARDPLAWAGLGPFTLSFFLAARARVSTWDAIVSHWALPSALIAGAVRGSRPHVAVMHSADVFALSNMPFRARIAKSIAQGASTIACVSGSLSETFLGCVDADARARFSERVKVCPMGVHIEPPLPVSREVLRRSLGLTRFTVFAMGRLVPIKGFDVLLKAAAKIPEIDVVIAGEGPEASRLRALAADLGARVKFVGVVAAEEKRAWLTASDVFVMPSRRSRWGRTEGTPTALLEAMAHECLPLLSELPANRELLADGQRADLFDDRRFDARRVATRL